jgi:6-pyruvoyltetrahydropterin/6-carboxytetrahydropterin synthase
MHILTRQVRFTIDPFGKDEFTGANSYVGKPTMEGFGLYGSLWVHLKSQLNPDTGFVVNVSQIDAEVRDHVLPFLCMKIRQSYARRRIPALSRVYQWLGQCGKLLDKRFDKQELYKLELELNPFRKISVGWEKNKMLTYTEQFEFAAMHKLWNPRYSLKTNYDLFGK